jgi:hypothetical protein
MEPRSRNGVEWAPVAIIGDTITYAPSGPIKDVSRLPFNCDASKMALSQSVYRPIQGPLFPSVIDVLQRLARLAREFVIRLGGLWSIFGQQSVFVPA